MFNQEKQKSAGRIRVDQFEKQVTFNLAQFLQGGLKISTITCIDYTGSNGAYNRSTSLHYLPDEGRMAGGRYKNLYQQALEGIFSILTNYSEDGQIMVYGFGAKPLSKKLSETLKKGETSHFFPCSGSFDKTSGLGVDGVLKLYKNGLKSVEMSGPTRFTPLLREVIGYVSADSDINPNNYTVLAILTDGAPEDMEQTKQLLIREANRLPLSVIFIGIGDEDFRELEEVNRLFDSRSAIEETFDICMRRDGVRFLRFGGSQSLRGAQARMRGKRREGLVSEAQLLEFLPQQILGYYRMIRKAPNEPLRVYARDIL